MSKLSEAIKYAKYAKYANPDHARKLAQHMVPHVVRPAQIIWNKALGAVFAILGIYFFGYGSTHKSNPAGMVFGIFLGVVMMFFAGTSFWRVRKLTRIQEATRK